MLPCDADFCTTSAVTHSEGLMLSMSWVVLSIEQGPHDRRREDLHLRKYAFSGRVHVLVAQHVQIVVHGVECGRSSCEQPRLP